MTPSERSDRRNGAPDGVRWLGVRRRSAPLPPQTTAAEELSAVRTLDASPGRGPAKGLRRAHRKGGIRWMSRFSLSNSPPHKETRRMSDEHARENAGLRRDLKARHITMIAIGGSIGTGLFVASGATIAQAGPGSALLAYSIIGLMVYFLMTSLGELAAFEPSRGPSPRTGAATSTKASASPSVGTTATTGRSRSRSTWSRRSSSWAGGSRTCRGRYGAHCS